MIVWYVNLSRLLPDFPLAECLALVGESVEIELGETKVFGTVKTVHVSSGDIMAEVQIQPLPVATSPENL